MPYEKSNISEHKIKTVVSTYYCNCEMSYDGTEEGPCPRHAPNAVVPACRDCRDCQKAALYDVILYSGKAISVCRGCSDKRQVTKPKYYD